MLLGVVVVAGVAYGWRMGSSLEIYYAAAVRSMAASWHDFAFAAFDPAGTVSVDKLPGALWVQALSVRLLGAHPWAVALPQAVEGAATVLVLFRAVRRLVGPPGAIVAAGALAVCPAVVTLDRGNIPDTLLVLLLVLAADAVVGAVVTGRLRDVLLAGVWVGLAFQAKMVEAWLVVPALAVTVLVAGEGSRWSRWWRVGAMACVATVVSLSWMVFVQLTPASQRPYVDGSSHDSVFEQVFDYNGFGRVGQPSPNAALGRTLDIPTLALPSPAPSWDRLLRGAYGRDDGWLLPPALTAAVGVAVARRRRSRTDRARAGIVLWGSWLAVLFALFSVSATVNSYYLAALAPPTAALLGIGATVVWDRRRTVAGRVVVAGTVLLTTAYGAWLLPASGTGLPGWLRPALPVLGVLAAVTAAVTVRPTGRSRWGAVSAGAVGAVTLLVPVVASASVVADNLGPFDTPFQPAIVTAFTRGFFGAPLQVRSVLPRLEAARNGAPDLMATQTSVLAAPFIFATGQEVLPIGGYTGTIPEPSVAALRSMVAAGRFHLVLTAAHSHDPRVLWIAHDCLRLPTPVAPPGDVTGPLGIFYCTPR